LQLQPELVDTADQRRPNRESHLLNDHHPVLIHLGDRKITCESTEDLILLKEAKILESDPARVLEFTIGRLHLIKEACQRYSLGKYQRLVNLAIRRTGR
jgi:hypothetical protein